MKDVVVLKNLPSNVIEEAIVILKHNQKVKVMENRKFTNNVGEMGNDSKQYIVKEAEMIIKNCIEEKKVTGVKQNIMLERKYKKMRAVAIGIAFLLLVSLLV